MSKSISKSFLIFPSELLFTLTGLFVVICPYNIAIVAPKPNIPRACLRPNFDPYRTVPKARGTCFGGIPGPLSFTVKMYCFGSGLSGFTAFIVISILGKTPL